MDETKAATATDWDEAAYHAMQARVRGTNVDEVTLLATDYLNHFNEIVMLLEMVPDMPEILEDAKEWAPKTYVEHFRDSSIADKDLAIEAYPLAPPKYRIPFERAVRLINELIARTVRRLEDEVSAGDMDRVRDSATGLSRRIQRLMDSASAIMHGATNTMAQTDIDDIMDV